LKHNRIVSRRKAFVSSTNVNCLISEEVSAWGVNMYFYILKVDPAESCTNLWLSLNILRNTASQKHPLSSPEPSPWPGKVPINTQFSIF